MKTAAEQIDFQTTILSRFDLIFVVKDARVEAKDKRMAKHIMNLHMGLETAELVGDIDVPVLKRYIEFCRSRVSPRLTVDACESLRNQFVRIRSEHRNRIREGSVIPITIRQLEAIVRLSESIARMSCTPDVTDAHVQEAFRLFRVSTLDAASTGLDIDGTAADPDFINKVKHLCVFFLHLFLTFVHMCTAYMRVLCSMNNNNMNKKNNHNNNDNNNHNNNDDDCSNIYACIQHAAVYTSHVRSWLFFDVLQVTAAEKWIRGRMAVGSSIPERVLMEASVKQVRP
jgi:hypothetical protein